MHLNELEIKLDGMLEPPGVISGKRAQVFGVEADRLDTATGLDGQRSTVFVFARGTDAAQ
jgi:hypothetical protein